MNKESTIEKSNQEPVGFTLKRLLQMSECTDPTEDRRRALIAYIIFNIEAYIK